MEIITPYLIQRCKIRKDPSHVKRFSENVETDYMGSSEFEWGALPQSLRRIYTDLKIFHIVQVKEITNDKNKPLIVWSRFPFEMLTEYISHLIGLRKGNLGLKESSHFELKQSFPDLAARTDLWWDLDNDVMFSFRPDIMKVLPDSIRVSVEWMDEQKKLAAVDHVNARLASQ